MPRAEATQPVRLYVEDDVRLPRRLSTFLKEQIDGFSGTVLDGQLSPEDYKFYAGQIAGLRSALEECERIAKEIAG